MNYSKELKEAKFSKVYDLSLKMALGKKYLFDGRKCTINFFLLHPYDLLAYKIMY